MSIPRRQQSSRPLLSPRAPAVPGARCPLHLRWEKSTVQTQMPQAPGRDRAEGSTGLCRAHDPSMPRPLGPSQGETEADSRGVGRGRLGHTGYP